MQIKSIYGNLISGYNRDVQLSKEPLIKAFEACKESLAAATIVFESLSIDSKNCKSAMSKDIYAAEEAYKLVKKGMAFRDAYMEIGKKYK